MAAPLPTDREALAQELASLLQEGSADVFLEVARTLVAAGDRQLFGDTEFKVRDLLLKLGARAYDAVLAQKKTATRAPASPAPTATRPPASTPTAAGGP